MFFFPRRKSEWNGNNFRKQKRSGKALSSQFSFWECGLSQCIAGKRQAGFFVVGLVLMAGAFFGRFVVGGKDFWEQQFGLGFVAFFYQSVKLFFQCACPRFGRAVELGLAGGAASSFLSGLNVRHRSIFLRCFSTNQKQNFIKRRCFVNRLIFRRRRVFSPPKRRLGHIPLE